MDHWRRKAGSLGMSEATGAKMRASRQAKRLAMTGLGLVALALTMTSALPAAAQDTKQAQPQPPQQQPQQQQQQQPSNPVGAWPAPKVNPEPQVAGVQLDAKQLELVKRVGGYFNELVTLRGTFVQTASDNKRLRGKFYVKKPGRLRFEYNLPSKQLVVSDGQMLANQDWDLGTDDRIALDQTVFRILLRKDVDLLRDARIIDVQESDDLIILTLQDKSADNSGRIRLFMTKSPALELKEWVTLDAQGETRVELASVVRAEDLDAGLFKIESPAIKRQ